MCRDAGPHIANEYDKKYLQMQKWHNVIDATTISAIPSAQHDSMFAEEVGLSPVCPVCPMVRIGF